MLLLWRKWPRIKDLKDKGQLGYKSRIFIAIGPSVKVSTSPGLAGPLSDLKHDSILPVAT